MGEVSSLTVLSSSCRLWRRQVRKCTSGNTKVPGFGGLFYCTCNQAAGVVSRVLFLSALVRQIRQPSKVLRYLLYGVRKVNPGQT